MTAPATINKSRCHLYATSLIENKLDVRLEDETVWLTQAQMSQLFSVKENTITYHIKEIYKTEELEKEETVRKFRTVRKEGNRSANRILPVFRNGVTQIEGHGFRLRASSSFMTSSS